MSEIEQKSHGRQTEMEKEHRTEEDMADCERTVPWRAVEAESIAVIYKVWFLDQK